MKKIIKTLLVVMVVVLAITALAACEQECQHTGGTATCTEKAVCELCGESYGETLAHKPAPLPAIEATCSKEGRTEGSYCRVCNTVLVAQEATAKLEHEWVANVDRDFTCTIDGLKGGNHCSKCGEQDGTVEVIGAHCVWGEDYVHTEPTCGKAGILAHDCTVCGETEKVADIPATGEHKFTVDVEAKAPTCLPGYEAHKACEVCGTPDPETFVEIPGDQENGHLFEEENYVVYTEPTCTEQGLLAGYCSYCGNLYGLAYIPAAHKYVDGVCTVCGEAEPEHTHVWSDATCTEPQKCECGETQGEALGHTYVKGVCSVCQAQDPEYVDYYLVGYINGADYGCEADHANLGEYKFVDGKLVVTFTQDSYVFVKSGNLKGESVKWYLFETYTTGKEGTLIENKSEKMFVPGNVEVTFTLTVNEDGTLTLAMDYHTHVFGEATCTSPAKCECGETQGEALGHVDETGDYMCDRCSAKVLPADGTTLTIPQALAIAKMQSHNTYTTQKYYITGIVTNVYNTTYGNLYLKDADGNQICIYGLYTWDKAVRYDKMEYKPIEGDELTVYTVLGMYNTTAQGKDAWMDDVVAHEHDYKAVVTAPTCTKVGYTTHTCSICDGYYIDAEVPALGHTTESGVCDNCGLTIGGDAAPVEVKVSKSAADIMGLAGLSATNGTSVNNKEIALDGNISIICSQGKAGTAPSYYSPAIRLYQNGATLTVKGTGMKTIIITVDSSAGDGPISVSGGTASALTSMKYTITVNEGVDEVVITTTGTDKNSRVYVSNIEVVYEQ